VTVFLCTARLAIAGVRELTVSVRAHRAPKSTGVHGAIPTVFTAIGCLAALGGCAAIATDSDAVAKIETFGLRLAVLDELDVLAGLRWTADKLALTVSLFGAGLALRIGLTPH
jgi:hypothetical protein